MDVLERAVEFHEHINECTVCTAGARDDIFCMAGFRLLLMAMNESMEVVERSILGRASEPKARPQENAQALPYRESLVAAPSRSRATPVRNGIPVAHDKVQQRAERVKKATLPPPMPAKQALTPAPNPAPPPAAPPTEAKEAQA